MKYLRLLAAGILVGLLGGCATISALAQPVNMDELNRAAFAAKSAYALGLLGAAQIVAMPRCEKSPAPCVPQAVVNTIRKLDLAADTATQAAEDLVRTQGANPPLVKVGVDAATKSVAAFNDIVNIYKVK